MLIRRSENEVVDRGFQAVVMVYQLTNRVPALIKQSHLERKEGTLLKHPTSSPIKLIHTSMVDVLVAYL